MLNALQKILLITVLLFANSAAAGDIIAFRGMNEVFDHAAFKEYARLRGLRPISFSSTNTRAAIDFINNNVSEHYELYGFSQGAVAVRQVLEYQHRTQGLLPQQVITIGAYKTTNVDFSKYKVPFINYFDSSSVGNAGPGKFLLGTAHLQMQQRVNEITRREQD